jgi:hypothetical protein
MIDPSYRAIYWWIGKNKFWVFSVVRPGVARYQHKNVWKIGSVNAAIVAQLSELLREFSFKSALDPTESHKGKFNVGAIRFESQRWYYKLNSQKGFHKFVSLGKQLIASFEENSEIVLD